MDDSLKKLSTLLDYLIHHNAEHAEEIRELALNAQSLGRESAQKKIERGVALMLQANEALKAANDELKA